MGDDELRFMWSQILMALTQDPGVTPPLYGFASLIEPKGIMAGTIYLEVPNDFTRSMIEQRLRAPLLGAIGSLGIDAAITTFAIVVNPDLGVPSAPSELALENDTENRNPVTAPTIMA